MPGGKRLFTCRINELENFSDYLSALRFEQTLTTGYTATEEYRKHRTSLIQNRV